MIRRVVAFDEAAAGASPCSAVGQPHEVLPEQWSGRDLMRPAKGLHVWFVPPPLTLRAWEARLGENARRGGSAWPESGRTAGQRWSHLITLLMYRVGCGPPAQQV
ncbi:hypothetical protein Sme01_23220 [Sphaerisporangium melleum]|uniref:Uncharacterized protein n=1 Tax=Sphaerisporangium melleum TaxID=321316 RepID=A0A917RS56_9ACTN|nr:hypothetical protein GCM10007964_73750 [Sphaerisporangium melleum]GII69846.1 hypothetical protein Sme01_23220 [Sphaerisporangium melleum]